MKPGIAQIARDLWLADCDLLSSQGLSIKEIMICSDTFMALDKQFFGFRPKDPSNPYFDQISDRYDRKRKDNA